MAASVGVSVRPQWNVYVCFSVCSCRFMHICGYSCVCVCMCDVTVIYGCVVCAWLDRCAFECVHVFFSDSDQVPTLLLWCSVSMFASLGCRDSMAGDPWAATSLGVSREGRGRPVFNFAILSDPPLLHSALHPAFRLSSETLCATKLLSVSPEAESRA